MTRLVLLGVRLTVAALATSGWLAPAVAQDFNGYPCTGDCSGHQAGYDWAEQNGVTDPSECGGNSQPERVCSTP